MRFALGVYVSVLPVQKKPPVAAGLIENAPWVAAWFIGSENNTWIVEPSATLVAPPAGLVLMTVGGVKSPVVKLNR